MSENYVVSARKYRPTSFATVVGQQALTHTLKTAIKNEQLAHAYLFCGPRGVGKTTCARIFSKAINCTNLTPDGEPCNECESCRAFNEQRSFNIIELDAASNNGVEDIRKITEQVLVPPQVGRYRVFIIDEVHMLSQAAFNAFLKTLEEPPEYAIFILATTEKQKIIPTILSRCQIYDFARITVPDIVEQLQHICADKGVTAESAALNVIAQKADGAMRDALSIFDQVLASSEGNITYQSAIDNLNVLDYDYYFRLDDAFASGDVPQALLIYKEVRDKGFDSRFFINGLSQHIRDLMVASNPASAVLLEMNTDVAQRHIERSARFNIRFFYLAIDLCNTCDLNYRDSNNKQLLVELTLIKLCQIMGNTPVQQASQPGVQKITPAAAPQQVQAAPQQPAQASAPPRPAPAPSPQPRPQAPAPQPVSQPAPQQAPQPQAPARAPQAPVAQAPAVSHPAPQPAPAKPRPASPPRILINRLPAATQPQAAAAPAAAAVRNNPFTPEQLAAAWQRFIDSHPGEMILLSAMRNSVPERVDDTTYKITVENNVQIEAINSSKLKLMQFLRNEVQNDMLAIETELGERELTAQVMTQRELFEDLKSRNDAFSNIVQRLSLSLS